jgi:uncharacterized protein YcbK (DUF882 family)
LSAVLALSPRDALAQAARIVEFGGQPHPAAGPSTPAPAVASTADFWAQPRVLRLRHARTGERLETAYWRNGSLDASGYRSACHFLRDDHVNEEKPIDPRLLDLVCAMQAWVSLYGFKKSFVVTSGYRSQRTNARLEGAARNSMHLYGRAVDLVFPDLPVSYMGKLAQHYSAGGVGFYPSSGFVHVDTGRVRSWRR